MHARDTPNAHFNLRVAGACLRNGCVLAQTARHMDFYVLPGGKIEVLEDSRTALVREMREELGCEISLGRLLWVVENFFDLEGKAFHEICLVHEMTPLDSCLLDTSLSFRRTPPSEPDELLFRWLPLESLAASDLKPEFLQKELLHPPDSPKHLIVPDDE